MRGKDIDIFPAQFVQFCETNVGNTVEQDYKGDERTNCTPIYIAQRILKWLE